MHIPKIFYFFFYAARVAYAKRLAPEGLGATAQALLGAVGGGLSGAAGATVGGLIYDGIGGAGLFRLAALGSGVALVFFLTMGAGRDPDAQALK